MGGSPRNLRRQAGGLVVVLAVVASSLSGAGASEGEPTGAVLTASALDVREPGARERRVRYAFPVARCEVHYPRSHHHYPAADLFADRGCAFVAPVAGRVDEVSRRDRWRSPDSPGSTRGGRSVSLVGVDGVRYYGSHLARVAAGVRPGTRVQPGRLLGRVGSSGSARGTAPHLHFGISWPTPAGRWWVRRGTVAPQPFLDAWREGRDRSPVRTVRAAKRRTGGMPRCVTYC